MSRGTARILAAASVVGLFFLYFLGLTRTGLIGPDEPRYAAIGRAMAASGDWITPRLWGSPWFEKPALLYWMTAAGFKAGLGVDWAPRLPVALAGVAFLMYFFFVLRHEFGDRPACYAATMLATSAGWLAYSHVGNTDLPMSAALAAAMLATWHGPFAGNRHVSRSVIAGILLGLAVLAKGLVPLVLFLPVLWFLRHRIRDLLRLFGAAVLIAAPWYVLVTLRNGAPFLQDFFWKQHFSRFVSSALLHERPIWFYVPVLLAGLFPWSPLLILLFTRRIFADRRAQFLLAWFAWGFIFFSASRNKLPGYLLPLMPPLAALLGIATAEARARSPKLMAVLAASAALLCLVPLLEDALPQALLAGISHTPLQLAPPWIMVGLIIGLGCAYCEWAGFRDIAVGFVAGAIMVAVVTIVWRVYPQLDRQVSGRATWIASRESITCLPPSNRSKRYSINYYSGRNLPDCN
jgi:4-amino-4-deoxy-L-arabinose transferase-like glycosyltransferase